MFIGLVTLINCPNTFKKIQSIKIQSLRYLETPAQEIVLRALPLMEFPSKDNRAMK